MMSIVGIVAVMMLIVAGMRYITAAGNAASVTDAKGMTLSAITGLLLALLSFVIIKTINPDVLYLKKPGSNFDAGDVVAPNNACYKNFDLATNSCTCGDGTVITSNDVNDCISDCKVRDIVLSLEELASEVVQNILQIMLIRMENAIV